MAVTSNASRSNTAIFALLGLASAMCLALVGARTVYAHTGHFQFLIWNLFLAWIPLGLAALAYRISTRRSALARLIVVPTAIVWLCSFRTRPTSSPTSSTSGSSTTPCPAGTT